MAKAARFFVDSATGTLVVQDGTGIRVMEEIGVKRRGKRRGRPRGAKNRPKAKKAKVEKKAE